ncbi:MAG: Sec-independent protein translocase protein TatB [bacterium]|nr:Sec-independent protein translocase protein TatB [bacterium]
MGNLGWAEIAVIVVVALVVLGPEKLPGAARQIGNVLRQVRKISTGFQQELQNALDEPIEAEARQRGQLAVEQSRQGSSPGNEESKTQTEQTSDPPPSSQ